MAVAHDWTEHRLGDVIKRAFSGPSPTCEERNVRGEEWGVLKTTCSTADAGWDPTKHKVLPVELWGMSHLEVRPGDSIITKAGPRHRVAVPAFVSHVRPRIIPSGKMICLRPDPSKIEPGFLALALADRRTQSYLDQRTTGMAESQVNYENADLLGAPLWLPDIDDQRRIMGPLNDAHSLITALEQMIAKKQAIKQGMMQQLLTGKTRLPGFTALWHDVTLGEMAQFSKGMGLPKSSLAVGGRQPCVHYGELFTHYGPEIRSVTSRTNDTSLRVRSVANDVLMPTSDVTPRGLAKASALMADGVVLGGDILVIRSDRHRLFGPFLAHAIRLDANQVLQLVRGSTVYHLYAADMRTFQLKLPPVDEQRAICEALRDVEDEIELLDGRLTKARAIKTGMMQELLTGRTRLRVEEGAA